MSKKITIDLLKTFCTFYDNSFLHLLAYILVEYGFHCVQVAYQNPFRVVPRLMICHYRGHDISDGF